MKQEHESIHGLNVTRSIADDVLIFPDGERVPTEDMRIFFANEEILRRVRFDAFLAKYAKENAK